MDFAGKIKREKNKRKEKCGHIFADYLQLLQIDKENEKKQKNRVSEINFLFVLGCMYGYWWMYRLPFINSNRKILVKTAFFFRFCSPSTHTLNRDQTKLYIHYTLHWSWSIRMILFLLLKLIVNKVSKNMNSNEVSVNIKQPLSRQPACILYELYVIHVNHKTA